MQIEKLGAGPWAEIGQDGMSVVTVDGETFDLDMVRGDTEECIEVRDGDGNFVAHIVTPPDRHTAIFEGRVDEGGEPVPSEVSMPLEMDRVRIVLWTKIENTKPVEE